MKIDFADSQTRQFISRHTVQQTPSFGELVHMDELYQVEQVVHHVEGYAASATVYVKNVGQMPQNLGAPNTPSLPQGAVLDDPHVKRFVSEVRQCLHMLSIARPAYLPSVTLNVEHKLEVALAALRAGEQT